MRERLDDLVYGKGLYWMMVVLFLFLLTGMDWWRYVGKVPATLAGVLTETALTLIVGVFAGVRVRRAWWEMKTVKQGIRGEVHVSQYLRATCVPQGYRMFDDVPGKGSGGKFNIDHVLIGPGGVFSIETKNWELPAKGTTAFMTYEPKAGTLTEPDGTFHDKEVRQAKANGDYVRKLLAERVNRQVFVKPVLILPGWYVKDPTPRPRPIWIMGNETLHQWLEEEEVRLSEADVAALATELGNYVRNFGK